MNKTDGPIAVTRTSKRGTSLRITLPKEVADRLSIGVEQFLGFYSIGEEIVLRKIK